MKVDNWDIVRDFRAARGRLRLGRYERYLAERLAVRVALLLGKRDEGDRGGDNPGDKQQAGGRAVSPDSLARAPANNPPTRGESASFVAYPSSTGCFSSFSRPR